MSVLRTDNISKQYPGCLALDRVTVAFESGKVNAIRGGDYSATKGKCEFLDGIVLSANDKAAVNAWRVDNGFAAIE